MATVTCNPGYQYAEGGDVRSLICQQSGQWSSEISRCQAIPAKLPDSIVDLTDFEGEYHIHVISTYSVIHVVANC